MEEEEEEEDGKGEEGEGGQISEIYLLLKVQPRTLVEPPICYVR